MNQEEFLTKIKNMLRDSVPNLYLKDYYDLFDQFFSQNVVIPKGENRHPYADVLHEWIEGAEIQVKLDGNWSDYLCSRSYIDKFEYRIKPSEPVYEWQWYFISDGLAEIVNDGEFLTDEEAEFHCVTGKFDATKKERKQ